MVLTRIQFSETPRRTHRCRRALPARVTDGFACLFTRPASRTCKLELHRKKLVWPKHRRVWSHCGATMGHVMFWSKGRCLDINSVNSILGKLFVKSTRNYLQYLIFHMSDTKIVCCLMVPSISQVGSCGLAPRG